MKCSKCRKEKDENHFKGKNNKITKHCAACREKCKTWREKNKKRIQLYNKFFNENHKKIKDKILVVYAKRINAEESEWTRFDSQAHAASVLKLHTSNISKVLNGHIRQTGGYDFKIEEENVENIMKDNVDWNTIKNENNITDKVKGYPSPHRTVHETINGITGKKCCTCKTWHPLTDYNKSSGHWDKLRVECKDCLVAWRKQNRKELNRKQLIYERKRKKIDPEFKLVKTLRSRLGTALKRKNAEKNHRTMDLIGQTPAFVRIYLEKQFTEGMSWDNHGKWHIDHRKACRTFDLLNEEEQRKCFHYTNLQPLWGPENMAKGGDFDENTFEYKWVDGCGWMRKE
jgi:transcription elongation factor Elf1